MIAEVLKKAGYDVTTTPVPASGPLYATVSASDDAFHASVFFQKQIKDIMINLKIHLLYMMRNI